MGWRYPLIAGLLIAAVALIVMANSMNYTEYVVVNGHEVPIRHGPGVGNAVMTPLGVYVYLGNNEYAIPKNGTLIMPTLQAVQNTTPWCSAVNITVAPVNQTVDVNTYFVFNVTAFIKCNETDYNMYGVSFVIFNVAYTNQSFQWWTNYLSIYPVTTSNGAIILRVTDVVGYPILKSPSVPGSYTGNITLAGVVTPLNNTYMRLPNPMTAGFYTTVVNITPPAISNIGLKSFNFFTGNETNMVGYYLQDIYFCPVVNVSSPPPAVVNYVVNINETGIMYPYFPSVPIPITDTTFVIVEPGNTSSWEAPIHPCFVADAVVVGKPGQYPEVVWSGNVVRTIYFTIENPFNLSFTVTANYPRYALVWPGRHYINASIVFNQPLPYDIGLIYGWENETLGSITWTGPVPPGVKAIPLGTYPVVLPMFVFETWFKIAAWDDLVTYYFINLLLIIIVVVSTAVSIGVGLYLRRREKRERWIEI